MRASLLLILIQVSVSLSTPVLLGQFSSVSMSTDGITICGVQNKTLFIFSQDRVVQTIPDVINATLSGDAQWLIVVSTESTLITYARKRDTIWAPMKSSTQLPTQSILRLLIDDSTTRLSISVKTGLDITHLLFSRAYNDSNFQNFWNLTSDRIELSQDLMVAFEVLPDQGVKVYKMDWFNQQLLPLSFVHTLSYSPCNNTLFVNADGSSFVLDNILYRNSSQGWIYSLVNPTNPWEHLCLLTYAFSRDGTFMFKSALGFTWRYLLSDLTRTHLPSDLLFDDSGFYMTSNYNGSRILYSNTSTYVVDIERSRYPAGGICEDDTWCQDELVCGPAHYCYVPGTVSKVDYFKLRLEKIQGDPNHLDIFPRWLGSSHADCIDAGSSPLFDYEIDLGSDTRTDTNCTLDIFDDSGSVRELHCVAVTGPSNIIGMGVDFKPTESHFNVTLQRFCVDEYATSDKEVFSRRVR